MTTPAAKKPTMAERKADARKTLLNAAVMEEETRLEAKEIAAKSHAAKKAAAFTGFEDISNEPEPDKPSALVVTGLAQETTHVVVRPSLVSVPGHRSAGKTWVAAVWAAQEIRAGDAVVWVDFERQRKKANERLKSAGIPRHMIAKQFRYTATLPPLEAVIAESPVVVCIDAWRSLESVLAPGEGDPGARVDRIYVDYLNPLFDAGITVAVLDHMPISGSHTYGSERKESAPDYVLAVEMKQAFGRTQPGFSTITSRKDRNGWFPEGTMVGCLWHPGDGSQSGPGVSDYPDVPEIRAWAPLAEGNLAALNSQRADAKELRVVTTIEIIREHPDEFRSRREFVTWALANAGVDFATEWEAEQAFKAASDGGKIQKFARGYRTADFPVPEAGGTKALAIQLHGGEVE